MPKSDTLHNKPLAISKSYRCSKKYNPFRAIKIFLLIVFSIAVIVLQIPKNLDEQHLNLNIPQQSTPKTSGFEEFNNHFDKSPLSLSNATIDKVYVDKSTQKLYLLQDGKAVKSYHIALGDVPKGHKQQEGDERTPEGTYTLDYKNENSIAYRSIHVSYPNATDVANAKARGVSPGGDIMIHGQMNGYEKFTEIMQKRNWTDGCMAVSNDEMDEIMEAVKVGTPIEIVW